MEIATRLLDPFLAHLKTSKDQVAKDIGMDTTCIFTTSCSSVRVETLTSTGHGFHVWGLSYIVAKNTVDAKGWSKKGITHQTITASNMN
ncbi:hypothetical protein YC2023_041417 [Brassica napus]